MQIFPTRMCNVTAWRHSRLRAHWLMALVPGGWGGIPRELQRLLSLIGYSSTGGVCGRSLTAGEILFTGRQTCSLYLILWLCGLNSQKPAYKSLLAAIDISYHKSNLKFILMIRRFSCFWRSFVVKNMLFSSIKFLTSGFCFQIKGWYIRYTDIPLIAISGD